ncbi:unnamed protein product [Rhizoctonia solani]|uniref:DNA topoisomerase n=1 Tax=Rhizoctonia solani TaxID=456999 RepID=A0A8H3DBJ2_9AGAM|nr:unnamed protein product [Rhizoctonia solani]
MEDAELAAIRAARLNQLQQQAGASSGSRPSGGFPGAQSGEDAGEEGRQSEDQMKRDLLATVLDSAARERLARISLVRPALSGQIEQILLRMAQTGQLRGRVTEQQLIGLLEQAEESQGKTAPKKVVYQRRKELDDDDFDLLVMSSRLPRSPHVPHSTTNAHPIAASHAKSYVLAGVQDAYWSDDEDENLECPLCLEEMDLSDLHFKPCPCGYQICNFCWHHIKENLNGRCPACRREYTEQPAEFKSVTAEEQKRLNAQKRKRDKERKELEALNRRHLANVRIVQRNLVYVTGLGSRFAKEELLPSLRSSEYFGQYGKVSKILLVKRAATLNRPADVGVYITYHRREDAARAIAAVDGSPSPGGGGEIMRASYGTTKYCMNFLRGVQCTNNSCLDLHEWGDERDCFTKEDLATLKHAMKDSETRQAPAPAPRKRAEDTDGTSAPPMGAALPRGASWGQNRGALPPAPAVLPSSTSSAFPAITASLASSAQSSRQQRATKARGAATERPATPGRNRRSERTRERGGKSTEAATNASAVPGGLTASRPSTPALSNPSSRPSTASKSPRDAFKSPTLAAAQPTPLANVHVPAETPVTDVPSPKSKEEDSVAPQSPPKPTTAPTMPPPPPGLSLPPPPPGLTAVSHNTPATQSVPTPQTSPSGTGPSQSQYQMSGAAKALLDDVRARREAAPPASTQQSPFPDFDRTLSNLTGGGFSFSFNMGSNAYNRGDIASGPYASTAQDDMPGPLPGRGVSGFFDPFRKSDTNAPLPPPPGLTAARPANGYEQVHLPAHVEPKTSYTGAFNPFADGPGSGNRTSSYDSERDAAERTSSRFGFARRQDSSGQLSNGYGTAVTSSPMRLHDQLPEAPMSPPLATSTQWQYSHNAADYGHQGMMPMNMTPGSLHQQLYAPPGLSQQHYPNGMELNAVGLKELLNIGGNLPGARIDARRSQSDTFDARFAAQPFSDPAIMSVAPREMFPIGSNLSQTHIPQLGPSAPGQPQAILAGLQSPPGIHGYPVLSPPPGFVQPARPYQARQNTQTGHPLTTGPMADSPMLTTASIIKSEPGSPALSASDFPALPPPSTDTQIKRETNQPFLQSRVTAADAKAAALVAKKASGVVPKKAPSKPTTKTTTKTTADDTPLVTSPSTSTPNTVNTEPTPKTVSASSGPVSRDSHADRPGKKANSQATPKVSTATDSRPTPASSKSGSIERSQSNAGSTRGKPNPVSTSVSTTKAPAPKPSVLIPAPEPVQQVPVLSRKQKKNKPMPPRPVVKVPKDEPAKTESVTPSAPSSPVSTLLRFEDGSSPPTPLTAEPAMPPEPSIVGMLVDLAAQYEIERLAFFDSQSYNTKLATPLRYGPLVQALSTLSMGGGSAAKSITPGTIDTAVTSFQQLLETLTQTISDMLRTLPRTTWDDTSSFDGVLKDMLKAEEFLEENTDDLPNWRDDDVTVLTQALEKRARWMEIQLVKLEELHRDINTSAVRSVLDQNDRGWGPRAREPRGESLAAFEQLGYFEESGIKRVMTIAELEVALVEAKEREMVAETELKEAILVKRLFSTHDLESRMKVLCVAEKPSIAKSVTQILSGGQFTTRNTQSPYHKNYDFYYAKTGDNYTMTAVSGHLTEKDFGAALRSWHSCDPFQLFDAPIETRVSKDGERIERNLLSEARGAQMLMIWTDCDREGENIGAEIEAVCLRANPRIRVKRARFSAIIPVQIHRAAQNPVELDRAQAEAVEARILLDLRYGAAFTRMQTLTLQPRFPQLEEGLISYGPCQFPTLGFVVSRYEQVQAFVPEPFWYIYLSIVSPDPEDEEDTVFLWRRHHIFEFDVALALYEGTVENPTARVTKVTKKPTKKWKPLPLTTVELQKAGSRLLHMTPKKVLDVAEKLYNDGFLSYPRTETDQFDPAFDFDTLIAKQTVDPEWGGFATGLQNGGFQRPRDGKKNDKAHPPIHPTAHAGNLTAEAKKVYEYVTRRFLACCSKDAEGFQTTVDVEVNDEEFYATGLIVLERNYLEVYKYDKWTGKHLPDFQEGQEFMPSVCELRDGETSSPSLLTEADLVTLMDKNGIGTDATIAQHIQTIVDRQYVIAREEGSTKYLVPSTLGIGLIEGYNRIGFDKSLSKPLLRRETERMMVQVCDRQTTKMEMMARSIDQYKEVFIRARQQFHLVIDVWHLPSFGAETLIAISRALDNALTGPQLLPIMAVWLRMEEVVGVVPEVEERAGEAGGVGEAPQAIDDPPMTTKVPTQMLMGAEVVAEVVGVEPQREGGLQRLPLQGAAEVGNLPPNQKTVLPLVPQLARRTMSATKSTGSELRQGVVCQCGEPAAERTVTKEGANKGRKFFTCGKDRTCDFFEWFDGPSKPNEGGSSGSMIPRSTIPVKRKSAEYVPPDDSRRCNCKLTAVQRTVQKEGPNKGRSFWACPNSEKARCGFFEWDDDSASGSGGGNFPAAARVQPRNDDQGKCFKCDQPGHWSNGEFRDYLIQRQTQGCSACPNGDTNPRRQARNEGSAGGDASGVCFKCNEPGHWSNACPNGDPGSFRGTSGRGRGRGRGKGVSKSRPSSRGGRGGRGRGRTKSGFGAADDY